MCIRDSLTTVLDADDGLPYQALRMIREQVADAVRRVLPKELVAVACYADAFNWQPSTRRPAGALNLHNESMCITPGLTRVVPFSRPMALGNSSLSSHALLKARWPGAKTCTQRSSRNAVAIPIRSRTATSNGMRDVVRAAVANTGNALVYAAEELKADRAVVLAAVTQDGYALRYASQYKANRAVVLAAVQQNGSALEFASEELRGDRAVVLAAMQ